MNQLLAWLKTKNITSHTIAAALVAIATLISTDEQARTLLETLLIKHPTIMPDIMLLAGVILKYSRDSSTRGAALNILADAGGTPPAASVNVAPPATPTAPPTVTKEI